jgi:hypothetical protein
VTDNYAAIRKATFERYLLDLMREVAYEEERLRFLKVGAPFPKEIRKVEFCEPESAESGFLITFFDHRKGIEITRQHTLYDDPSFWREGKLLNDANFIVGEILMLARGG